MPYYPPATTALTPAASVTDESSAAGVASAVGTSLNYARQDHNHGTQELSLALNIVSANFTIPANTTAVIPDVIEVASGITLEVGSGGYLEVT